jgi:hypothetical protein
MTTDADCPCGATFPVRGDQVGGIVNCPSCGKAVEVPGLHDPFWRLVQVGAAILWAGVSAVVFVLAGPIAGLITAVALGGLLWLVSRAF